RTETQKVPAGSLHPSPGARSAPEGGRVVGRRPTGWGAEQRLGCDAELVSLRRDGFDLDLDSRPGKFLDDQKRGRRVVIAHDPSAYAAKTLQDRLVRYVDGEFDDVVECHVGSGEDYADALEDHLDLFRRALGYGAVQARTHLSIAEQDSRVRGY